MIVSSLRYNHAHLHYIFPLQDNDGAHDLAVKIISKHDFQDGDQTKEWVLREIKTLKSLKKHNCPNIVCLLGENLVCFHLSYMSLSIYSCVVHCSVNRYKW